MDLALSIQFLLIMVFFRETGFHLLKPLIVHFSRIHMAPHHFRPEHLRKLNAQFYSHIRMV
jgi:hypothetical protein